jgi:hypothetical protein
MLYSFKVLALICSAGISASDCDANNARDVALSTPVANEIMCSTEAPKFAASLSNYRGLAKGEFIKLVCDRRPL